MRKYFLKYFAWIFSIALIIIFIQGGSILFEYREGMEKWKNDIYKACVNNLEENLKSSTFPKIQIDGFDLFGSIAHDNRISGYLVRDSEGAVTLTVGQTPHGRVLASFISPDEKITSGQSVKSKRKTITLNAKFDPNSDSFIIERSKISTDKKETFLPPDIRANDIVGSITVSYMDSPLLTVDILTYSPRTYIYSKQIVNPIMKSLIITLPVCMVIALIGAWYVSSRNTKYIDSVRHALKELAYGNDDVTLAENKNNELNDITVAVKELGANLKANKKSRNAWLNSISHDLNTPATAMKMIIDGLNDGIFTLDESTLKDLKNENDVLSERIEKVIEFSTLIADTKADIKDVDSQSLLQGLEDVNTKLDSAVIRCDLTLMKKAVSELVKNAKQNGTDVCVTVSEDDANFIINVKDTGVLPEGLSDSTLFEPWVRGDYSRTSGGNGLGLPIAGAVANLHKGKAHLMQMGCNVCAQIIWPKQD